MGTALSRRFQTAYKAQTDFNSTDISGSGFTVVEAAIPDFAPATELFPVESIRSGHFQIAPIPGSTHGGTLTLRFPLPGYSSSVPAAGAAATTNFLSIILKHLLGAQVIQAPVATGKLKVWTAGDPIEIDTTVTSTDLKAGAAVIGGGLSGVTTGYEMAVIQEVVDGGGTDHTLNLLFPVLGTKGVTITNLWGTVCSYVSDAELGATDPLSFTLQGLNTTSYLVLGGCIARSLKLPLSPRANPMCEAVFLVNDVRDGLTGAAISASSFTLPRCKPPTNKNGGRLVIGSTETALQTLDLEIATTWAPLHSHNARTGVSGLVATARAPKLTYTKPVTGAFANLVELTSPSAFGAFWGSQPGQMFGVVMPSPVVTALGDMKDDNGIWVQTHVIEPGQYTGDVGSDATADSVFRFYQG